MKQKKKKYVREKCCPKYYYAIVVIKRPISLINRYMVVVQIPKPQPLNMVLTCFIVFNKIILYNIFNYLGYGVEILKNTMVIKILCG